MKFWQSLASIIFGSKQPKESTLPETVEVATKPTYPDHRLPDDYKGLVHHAFTAGGVDYFQFDAMVNIPIQRFYTAYEVFKERELAVNPEILKGFIATFQDLRAKISGSSSAKEKGQLTTELDILVYKLSEQVNHSTGMLFELKLATIRFFTIDEDPLFWDWNTANKKLQHWKTCSDLPTFFLQTVVDSSYPSLSELEKNLHLYLKGEILMQKTLLSQLLRIGKEDNLEIGHRESLRLQEATLETMIDWLESQPISTT
jgi:hypothetical protein